MRRRRPGGPQSFCFNSQNPKNESGAKSPHSKAILTDTNPAADRSNRHPPSVRPWRRWAVRFAFLIIACALLVPAWPWDPATLAVPALSPYVAMASALATRSVSLAALLALPVLLVVLVRRRWFCRYVCPTGLLADLVGRIRGPGAARGAKLPPIGQWLALLTLGGAVLGYPLFLWLDPLAIFAGFVHAWGREAGIAVWLTAAGLPLVLLLSLLVPGVWCARLCPLGATQDLLSWPLQKLRRRKPDEQPPPAAWPLTRRVVIAGGLGAIGGAADVPLAGPLVIRALAASRRGRRQPIHRVVRPLRKLCPRMPFAHPPSRSG